MKAYLYLTILFILTFLFSCTLKKESVSIMLPEITLKDEQQEIFLQKKILIYEMISASKKLHQISWPILKNNLDICKKMVHILLEYYMHLKKTCLLKT